VNEVYMFLVIVPHFVDKLICMLTLFFLYMIIVSPDGLLQQSSTVADSSLFTFADGIIESVPRSYIEFAERLLLPQFKDLQDEEVCTIFSLIHTFCTWLRIILVKHFCFLLII